MLMVLCCILMFCLISFGMYAYLRLPFKKINLGAFLVLVVGIFQVIPIYGLTVFFAHKTYFVLAFPAGLSYGALLYLVFNRLMDREIKPDFVVHGVPFFLGLIFYIFLISSSSWRYNHFISFYIILDVVSLLLFIAYLIKILFDYCSLKKISLTVLITKEMRWVLMLLVFVLFYGIMMTAFNTVADVDTYAAFNLAFYLILLFPTLMLSKAGRKAALQHVERHKEELLTFVGEDGERGNNQVCLNISAEVERFYRSEIEMFISSKAYLDTDMNKARFSEIVSIAESHISPFLRKEYDKTFSGFVNHLRLVYASDLLKSKELVYTIDELSFISGFGSRASFYRNFTIQFGCTPHRYRTLIKQQFQ